MLVTSGKPGHPQVCHMLHLSFEERLSLHGRGSCDRLEPTVAGDYVTLTFQFEIGQKEIPRGGRMRIAWRWPFDWSELQTENPSGDGYLTVCTKAGVSIGFTFHGRGDLDPWPHDVELTVQEGSLARGDRVTVVCGDRAGGGKGWRTPTFIANSASFLMLLNPDNNDQWIRLPDAPGFPIVPGVPVSLHAVCPSDCIVGEPFDVILRAEDRWGNPTLIPEGDPCLAEQNGEGKVRAGEKPLFSRDPASYRFTRRFDKVGIYRLSARVPNTDLMTESNPIQVHDKAPHLRIFWGDLHSGQTEVGCGAGSLKEHFTFARDVAGLQFASQQSNDHYVTLEDWKLIRDQTEAFNDPGRFVTFLGCEWSPPTEKGGDRNVIYRQDEPRLRRSARFFTESDPDPEPDLPDAQVFLERMKWEEVLINLHAGGRTTNLKFHEPVIEPLVEVHSTHGTSEWLVQEALARGYRVGLTAGTDGVMTRPGTCQPGSRVCRNVRSGLTAIYARGLNKDDLWTGLKARRCYATSGERILLWVSVDGHPMGDEFQTDGKPLIRITAEGTAAIERVDLVRGLDLLCRWQIAPPGGKSEGLVRIVWGGTEAQGTARDQRVTWDGSLGVAGGNFLNVRATGFPYADDVVKMDRPDLISWRSVTAGNEAGIVVRIQGDAKSVCRFSTGPCSFPFSMEEVALGTMVVDAGGVGRHVSVGPAPREDGPRHVELSYKDSEPVEGCTPYWVRVVQVDLERAWSSPVYVTRAG